MWAHFDPETFLSKIVVRVGHRPFVRQFYSNFLNILGCDVGTMEVLIENTNVEVKAAARRTTNPHNPNRLQSSYVAIFFIVIIPKHFLTKNWFYVFCYSGSSAPAVMNILKKPFSNVGATNSLNNSKKLGGSGNSFVGLNNSGGSRSVHLIQISVPKSNLYLTNKQMKLFWNIPDIKEGNRTGVQQLLCFYIISPIRLNSLNYL